MSTHYIDAKAFTALFADRQANRGTIARNLQLLCDRVAGKLVGLTPEDREDVVSDAKLHCVRKLNQFDPSRPGADAFAYYTSVALNALRRSSAKIHRYRSRVTIASDADHDFREGSTQQVLYTSRLTQTRDLR